MVRKTGGEFEVEEGQRMKLIFTALMQLQWTLSNEVMLKNLKQVQKLNSRKLSKAMEPFGESGQR